MRSTLSQIFNPFGKVNKIYFGAICIFWVGFALVVWSMAPELLPGPKSVFSALMTFLTSKDFYRDLLQSLGVTMKAMLYSIGIACILAYLSTIQFFKPIAAFLIKLRYMSLIGLIFTFTLILSGAAQVKLSLLMFGIVPFFVLSLLTAIDKVEQKEYELCQTLKYTPWQMLYELVIWGRADYTIETIRANFAMAWLMITMVESFSMSAGGIGVQLFRANKLNHLDQIFALQFVIFGLGVLFDYTLQQMRYGLFPHVRYAELKKN